MSDARKTLESAVITATIKSCVKTRLTIDKCDELVPDVIDEIFRPATIWAVKEYLKEVEEKYDRIRTREGLPKPYPGDGTADPGSNEV